MTHSTGKFSCPHCQRQYKWSHERAGRSVRCKCGGKFKVPAGSSPPKSKQKQAGISTSQRPRPVEKPEKFDPFRESLEQTVAMAEADTEDPAPGADDQLAAPKRCPSCRRPVSSSAVICVECGANIKTGKQKKTKVQQARAGVAESGPQSTGIPNDAGLKIAGIGLACHFIGVVIFPLVLGVFAISTVATFAAAARTAAAGSNIGLSPTEILLSNIPAFAGLLLSVGLIVGGGLLCLAVPRAEARGQLIMAIVMYAVILPVQIFILRTFPVPENFYIGSTAQIFMVGIAWISIIGFFSELGDYLNARWVCNIAVLVKRMIQISMALSLLVLGIMYVSRHPESETPGFLVTLSNMAGVLVLILHMFVGIGYTVLTCSLACLILFGKKGAGTASDHAPRFAT